MEIPTVNTLATIPLFYPHLEGKIDLYRNTLMKQTNIKLTKMGRDSSSKSHEAIDQGDICLNMRIKI